MFPPRENKWPWNKNALRVWVRPTYILRSDDFGHGVVKYYMDNPRARIYAGDRGTEYDPEMQGLSKTGEVAGAIAVGFDPKKINFDGSKGPDKGSDFTAAPGIRPDVKTTEHWKQYVLWSRTINHLFEEKDFTHIISVTVEVDDARHWLSWWAEGQLTKDQFRAKRLTADGVNPKGLEEGTWYVPKADFHDIRELKQQAQRGPVGYDNEGHFRSLLRSVREVGSVRRQGLIAQG